MNKKILTISVFLLIIMLFSSCYTVSLDVNNPKPVDLTALGRDFDYQIVGHFDETIRASFTLAGLVEVSDGDIEDIINQKIAKYDGDAVINFHFETETGVMDYLIQAGVALGASLLGQSSSSDYYTSMARSTSYSVLASLLYSTRTVSISGDVVRYRN